MVIKLEIYERWSFNERLDELQASFLNISIDYPMSGPKRRKSRLYNDCLSEIVVPKEGMTNIVFTRHML